VEEGTFKEPWGNRGELKKVGLKKLADLRPAREGNPGAQKSYLGKKKEKEQYRNTVFR